MDTSQFTAERSALRIAARGGLAATALFFVLAARVGHIAVDERLAVSAREALQPADTRTVYLPLVSTSRQRLAPVSVIGGVASDIEVDGRLAVLAVGERVVVAEVSGPDAPRFVGESIQAGHTLKQVVLSDGVAWASVPSGPLIGFDLDRPEAPRLSSITRIPGEDDWSGSAPLAAVPGRVYVGLFGHVHLVDVNDPARPRWIASIELPAFERSGLPVHAYALAAYGDHLYAVAYISDDLDGRLVSVDWSTPARPRLVGELELQGNPTYELAVAGGWLIAKKSHVEFYDLSDPAAPRAVGWAGEDRWVYLPGDRLHGIEGKIDAIAVHGDHVWLRGDGRATRFRMNAAWPPVLESVADDPAGMLAAGPDRLVGVETGSMLRLGVIEPSRPGAVAAVERLGDVRRMFLTDNRAYVEGPHVNGMTILDVGDPGDPRVAGALPFGVSEILHADDRWLVVNDFSSGVVRHVDVRDAARPVLVAEHAEPQVFAYGPGVVVRDTLYVPGGQMLDARPVKGVFALPVDGSTAPRLWWLREPATDEVLQRIAVEGDRIVVSSDSGYVVLDVSSGEPSIVAEGRFNLVGGWLRALELVDDHVVAVDDGRVVAMVDGYALTRPVLRVEVHRLIGPGAPSPVATFELPVSWGSSVAASARTIVVADRGLTAWTFGEDFLTLDRSGGTPWPAVNVDVYGGLVAATSSAGFGLFSLER